MTSLLRLGPLGLICCLLGACGDDDSKPDLAEQVCSSVCNKVEQCLSEVPANCSSDCDEALRPVLELDGGTLCASEAEIDACITAFNNASCLSFLLPNPVPEACNLCGIDLEELLRMNADGGALDAGALDDGSVDAGGSDSAVPDSGGPDSGVADSGGPDSGTSDSGTSDSGTSDSGTADSAVPDASTGDGASEGPSP